MKCLRIIIASICSMILIEANLFCQYPLNITVLVRPPYSSNYSNYISGRGVLITVVNNTDNQYTFFLTGSITSNTGVSISVSNSRIPLRGIDIPKFGTLNLTGNDLQPFLDRSSLQISGISEQELFNGHLREGDYTICLKAFDFNNPTNQLSKDEPSGCSHVFTISQVNPPSLTNCRDSIDAFSPQNILFTWNVPTGGGLNLSNLQYELTIVSVPVNGDPTEVMNRTTNPFFHSGRISGLSFHYGVSHPSLPILIPGEKYAARITVYDITGNTLFRNQGKGEVCSFYYGNATNLSISCEYPSQDDWIPFNFFPIIVKYEPYSDSYHSWNSTIRIQGNNNWSDDFSRDLNWALGPLQTQRRSTFSDITQAQAQRIAVYKNLRDNPQLRFVRGTSYNYQVEVELNRNNPSAIAARTVGNFSCGMSRPRLSSPSNGASVPPGEINLTFRTAERPSSLLPEYAIVQSDSTTGGRPIFFNGRVEERWKLELSRTRDFERVIKTISDTIFDNFDLLNGNVEVIASALYRDETKTVICQDTGDYYWRVRWFQNPRDTNSIAFYNASEVFHFRISSAGSHSQQLPSSCLADCTAPQIQDRNPVDSIRTGNRVRIGLFEMLITEMNWNNNTASGRGQILVPYLRSPMRVRFVNIQINAAMQVISGEAFGEYDNQNIIPPGLANGFSAFMNMDTGQFSALSHYINDASRLVGQIANNTPKGLPIGFDNIIDGEGRRNTIGILGLKFTPQLATLNAMMVYDIPEFNGSIGLGATDICFHPGGISGLGQAMLYSPIDYNLVFSDSITLKIKKTVFSNNYSTVIDSGTYVRWDCNGFRSLQLKAEIIFGRNLLLPELPNGTIGEGNVIATFTTTIRRESDWSAALNFQRFQIAGLPGWGFSVNNSVLDFSNAINPSGIQFPSDYRGERSNFWKGFFLQNISVHLPPDFHTVSPSGRVSFEARNLFIDRTGFTGQISALNTLDINDGNIAGWGFSIDTIQVSIISNSFSSGGFSGKMKIPISDTALYYSSILRQDTTDHQMSYNFRVIPRSNLNARLWSASMTLLPTSFISVQVRPGNIDARLNLSGTLSISGQIGGVGPLDFLGMRFEQLQVMTIAPYISCNSFSFASAQRNLGNFPVSIDSVKLTVRPGGSWTEFDPAPGYRAGLEFILGVNLTGESNAFRCGSKMAIVGRLELAPSQSWRFSGIALDSIGIDGDIGSVSIRGSLNFYSTDPTFGDGFRGNLRATFPPGIRVQATAQFGSKNGFRYFYVDALASMPMGLDICTGLAVYGFGGGVYYNMNQATLPSVASLNNSAQYSPSPGNSNSGVRYTPSQNSSGFNATVVIGSNGGGKVYNADVTLYAEFSRSGINLIGLRGDIYVMCGINDRRSAKVWANGLIEYNVANHSFDANLRVYANYPNILHGLRGENQVGQAGFHVDTNYWQFKLGTPNERLGIRIISLFDIEAYLMVGKNLPPPASPPESVNRILGEYNSSRDDMVLGGNGFALGARASVETGPQTFLCFYGQFSAGIGFDFSLLEYSNSTCPGSAPGTTLGINGWYATGQIYGYITGDIGINTVFGNYVIINLAGAALLQGGLPNPTWVRGIVGGNYNILGGAIQGNCRFELSVGERCAPTRPTQPVVMDIVGDLLPDESETGVYVGSSAISTFNIHINEEFTISQTLNVGGLNVRAERILRFVLDYLNIKDENGNIIPGSLQVASDNSSANYLPINFMDPEKWYTANVRVHCEERINGRWIVARKTNGEEIYQRITHRFQTGESPDTIPSDNVLFSYPINRQRHFLQRECPIGEVRLSQGMPNLFEVELGHGIIRSYHIRFIPILGGSPIETIFQFENSGRRISFNIPNLSNQTTYLVQLVYRDRFNDGSNRLVVNDLLEQRAQTTQVGYRSLHNGEAILRTHTIDKNAVRNQDPQGKIIYSFAFRTSRFNTLREKLASFRWLRTGYVNFLGLEELSPQFETPELFDVFDIRGWISTSRNGQSYQYGPLISIRDVWSSPWHSNYIDPLIYNLYNTLRNERFTNLSFSRSNRNILIPPSNAVTFSDQCRYDEALNDIEINRSNSTQGSMPLFMFGGLIMTTGSSSSTLNPVVTISYEPGAWTPSDYALVNRIVGSVVSRYGSPNQSEFIRDPLRSQMIRFLRSAYPRFPKFANFSLRFNYHPPIICSDADNINNGSILSFTKEN